MTYSATILAESSLVSYFRLGETVGASSVADTKSGGAGAVSGSSVTLGQAGLIPSDPTNTAVTLSGTGTITGDATVELATRFDRSNAFSVECWVVPNVGRGSGAQTQVIWDKRTATSANQGYILFCAWNAGLGKTVVQFQVNHDIGASNAVAGHTTDIDLANGSTYHIVFTYDGSSSIGGCKVWVNATSRAIATDINGLTLAANSTQVPALGSVVGAALEWLGTLDELAIYNAVLVQGQIENHYLYASGLTSRPLTNYGQRPTRLTLRTRWANGLALCVVPNDLSLSPFDLTQTYSAPATAGSMTKVITEWGPAWHFGGSNSTWIDMGIPGNATLTGHNELTVSVLARSNTKRNVNANSSGVRNLLSQGFSTNSFTLRYFTADFSSPNLIGFIVGGSNECAAAAPFSMLDWTLFTGRFQSHNGAGDLTLFYNAQRVATAANGLSSIPTPSGVGVQSDVYLGGDFVPAENGRTWSGDIAAAYIWTRGLADAEIAALAQDPLAPIRPRSRGPSVLAAVLQSQRRIPWQLFAPVVCGHGVG